MKVIKNLLFFASLSSLIAFIPGCKKDQPKELLSGVVVVNVLEKELYDDCHIAGSISVPFDQLEDYAVKHISKSADIVVHCSNYLCSASGESVKILKRLGFEQVVAYEGGTAEWYQQGLPVEGLCKASYLHKKNPKITNEHDPMIATISVENLRLKLENSAKK